MDTTLRPRDIQARIRSGRSVEEVAEVAGMPREKVERFAAPVLAEREYVADQAMTAPVRRRGDSSGHRTLRVAVSERLMSQRVDIDDLAWDSARMEDGRWAVTARFATADAEHEAVFHFDVPARFSIAGNGEARWLLGEVDDTDADAEPTVELDETLPRPTEQLEPDGRVDPAPGAGEYLDREQIEDEPQVPADVANEDTGGLDILYDILDRSGTEYTEDSGEIPVDSQEPDPGLSIVRTLEDEPVGVSDASAVPDTGQRDFEPAGQQADYPVEPSLFDEEPEFAEPVAEPAKSASRSRPRRRTTVPPVEPVVSPDTDGDAPIPTGPVADIADVADVVEPHPEPETVAEEPAARKKGRKRASVPSWDEIMFGSPRSKG